MPPTNPPGLTTLIADRERIMDTVDQALDRAWPHRTGSDFERAMNRAAEELEGVIQSMEIAGVTGIELSRAFRYLGSIYSDLVPARGPGLWASAERAYRAAEGQLANSSDGLERAKLDFNYANALRQIDANDRARLEDAQRRLQSARTAFATQAPQVLAQVDEALDSVRSLLELLPLKATVADNTAELERMRQALNRGDAEAARAALENVKRGGGGLGALLASVGNAVSNLPASAQADARYPVLQKELEKLGTMVDALSPETTMSKDKNPNELRAEEALVEQVKQHSRDEGSPAALTDALIALVQTRGARQGVSADRLQEMERVVRQFGEGLRPPEAPAPVPDPTADDLFARFGLKPPEVLREEIKELSQSASAMRRATDAVHPLAEDTERSTKLPAAKHDLRRLDQALHQMMVQSGPGGLSSSRYHHPMLRLGDVHQDLQTLNSLEELQQLRRSRLYPNLWQFREVLLEGHAMVVQPSLGRIRQRALPTRVLFVGQDRLRDALAERLAALGLDVAAPQAGGDAADNQWQALQQSALTIFDFTAPSGPDRAATAYQLGWARALGRPMVLLGQPGERLPFNADIEPVNADDMDAIERATVDAIFLPPTTGLDRGASRHTLDFLRRVYRGRSDNLDLAVDTVLDVPKDRHDGDVNDAIRRFVGYAGNQYDVVTPEWPPDYPAPDHRTLFHVMPYRPTWAKPAQEAAESGVAHEGRTEYRRHDFTGAPHIIRSLWAEIARATHLLVDLTDLNDNVLIELGLGHVLGKHILLVAQPSVRPEALPPVLRAWRIEHYKPQQLGWLTQTVEAFLRRT